MNASLKFCSNLVRASIFCAWVGVGFAQTVAPQGGPRVVCLTPALAEVAADILGDELNAIVGVTDSTDHPAALREVPHVGPYHQFSIEHVVRLKPTLILASKDGNPRDRVERLIQLSFNVVVVDTSRLEMLPDMVQRVGSALQRPEAAARWIAVWKNKLNSFKDRARTRIPKKAVIVVGHDPLFVAAKQTFISDVVEWLGAENALRDLDRRYVQLSREELMRRKPDWIVDVSGEKSDVFTHFPSRVRVIRAKPDDVLRPSRRMLDGMVALERAMYGD
jgi:ABC-type hemin transport system substrate-binding protein